MNSNLALAPLVAKTALNLRQVLLVEDNEDDREHIAYMIQNADSGVVKAVATGTEALDHFNTHHVDCVILDYRLEYEDGLAILAKIKEIEPYCPVIILSGQGNERLAAQSIKEGAADYLIKQRLTETQLESAIDSAMSRSALEAKVAEQEKERQQFLSMLVHDLRSPLQQVFQLGTLTIGELEHENLVNIKSGIRRQVNIANKAANLVVALEEYALLDREISLSPISLTDIANAACSELGNLIAERNAVIDIKELPNVNGNEPQLIQLFRHLIQNGLEYNESETPWVGIKLESEGEEHVTFTVNDNGTGIPTDQLSTIFAPLQRLSGDSHGIGLALCQKIADCHDGKIWCTSIEGEGSQFHIRLPAMSAS